MPAPALRKRNKVDVLKNVFESKIISRAELSKLTGLSLSTLSYVVRELEQEGLITIQQHVQRRGRPTQLLRINPSSWTTIGIKVGREEVRGTLFDASMNAIRSSRVRVFSHLRDNEGYSNAIMKIIEDLKDRKLLGVGVCSSGIVNETTIIVSHLMNVRNLDLQSLLQSNFGLKKFILMNDVDALCYSLTKTNKKDYLVVTYGTGIGASYWGEGRTKHFEIGHAIVSEYGNCYCGQTGCLEYHASEYAVLREYSQQQIDFEDFAKNEEEKYREQVEQIRLKAAQDFDSVRMCYSRPLRVLSTVVGNLLMILKPSTVVFLGEGMVNREMVELIKANILKTFNREFVNRTAFSIEKADWEHGVAMAVVQKYLSELVR
ncbi:MAG TPA: ROK family transcriptional regulator [Pseudothermotoga sp.]|nr:ROK family transcriptional regulator [Pseudothermotoga sp.]HOK83486.1 ROK family transcriptional regulator [Pseudothermotoga sp.]HPP69559.1 ROK family transcriptional regulator [Pseudothermotoga sp.]